MSANRSHLNIKAKPINKKLQAVKRAIAVRKKEKKLPMLELQIKEIFSYDMDSHKEMRNNCFSFIKDYNTALHENTAKDFLEGTYDEIINNIDEENFMDDQLILMVEYCYQMFLLVTCYKQPLLASICYKALTSTALDDVRENLSRKVRKVCTILGKQIESQLQSKQIQETKERKDTQKNKKISLTPFYVQDKYVPKEKARHVYQKSSRHPSFFDCDKKIENKIFSIYTGIGTPELWMLVTKNLLIKSKKSAGSNLKQFLDELEKSVKADIKNRSASNIKLAITSKWIYITAALLVENEIELARSIFSAIKAQKVNDSFLYADIKDRHGDEIEYIKQTLSDHNRSCKKR